MKISEAYKKLIDEDAMDFSHLTSSTGLFVRKINVGYDMTLYDPPNKTVYGYAAIAISGTENYFIAGIVAKPGFGPLMYKLAMMQASLDSKGLMPSRDGDVRSDAWGVWEQFYKRNDVNKNTLDVTHNDYNFNIIDDIYYDDLDEKLEIFNEFHENGDINVIKALTIFNTVYSLPADDNYKRLRKIAEDWIAKGFDNNEAIQAGDNFWDYIYSKG